MHLTKLQLIESKIISLDRLFPQLNIWRLQSKKIVFTNGCFDLLHFGHIDYLAKAAQMGDKLIVGINSDNSTSNLKGPNRPITDEKSRSYLIASLFFVNTVVLFDEPTPYSLIKSIKPDILVKGADYTIDQIVGADIVLAGGGEVKTVEYISGYSTTAIEQKIKNG